MPYDAIITISLYSVCIAVALFFACRPIFGVFQQEGYAARPFLKWYLKPRNIVRRRYELLVTALLFLTAVVAVVFSFAGTAIAVAVALFLTLAFTALFSYAFRYALKVPLVFTRRMIRLSVCATLLFALFAAGMGVGLYYAAEAIGSALAHMLLRTVPLSVLPIVCPWLIVLGNLLMQTYEAPRKRALVRRASRTVAASGCIKIGITGSFGKTSVKEYARVLLGEDAYATPASYNTPIGIAACVNQRGLSCRYFLAEMGARKAGDIAELCDMVGPEYGVVTGICPQHLETFGSIEAIAREKGELIRRAAHTVVGRSAADLAGETSLVEGRDFGCENATFGADGATFDFVYQGERVRVHTSLLGRHAVEDIGLAAALCRLLGVPMQTVADRIPLIKPVPHRLEHSVSGGVHILDDSYNSNIEGAKNAAETLALFPGEKYVVTPGLVELGALEETLNRALGECLAPFRVILVGETLVLPVKQGYLDGGGDKEHLHIVPTLAAAQSLLSELLREGDSVLFLNDLPDKYS